MTNKKAWYLLGALGVMLFLAGCSSASIRGAGYAQATSGDLALQVVDRLPPPSVLGGTDQIVRIGDTLKIDVFGVDELDSTAQVDGSGAVTLPLIGPVAAAGKTQSALQNDIRQLYNARYLQNPQITLSVEQSVTVDGEFRKAGAYPVSASATLLRVVAAAGNFSDIGDPTNVFVYRTIDGRDYVARYDVAQIRAGRMPDEKIYGGDVVVAFPSGMKVLGGNLQSALGIARSATGLL
jgi:polysaccharide export outer membrane protein